MLSWVVLAWAQAKASDTPILLVTPHPPHLRRFTNTLTATVALSPCLNPESRGPLFLSWAVFPSAVPQTPDLVHSPGFRAEGLGIKVSGFGLRVSALGFRDECGEIRTEGLGLRRDAQRCA
jgi:hypothetical protein